MPCSVVCTSGGSRSGSASGLTCPGSAPPYLLHVHRLCSARYIDSPVASRCLAARRQKTSRPTPPVVAAHSGIGVLKVKDARSVADAARNSASSPEGAGDGMKGRSDGG
eukprot:1830519-Prymnesium_polylepis.1